MGDLKIQTWEPIRDIRYIRGFSVLISDLYR